jgi:ABC-type polar amino acid transport system ATPase subunit
VSDDVLRVEGLEKSYGGVAVLKGVTFTLGRGEVLSAIGSSGSGKSTMLRCINLLEDINGGSVHLEDRLIRSRQGSDTRGIGRRELQFYRSEVGMVFQNYHLFPHMTVLENIIEAPIHVRRLPRRQAVEAAEALLDKVRLRDRKDSYPHQLSGGQQQRIAIARALAMQPKVLLLDEVTSALDPELVGEVLKTVKDLSVEGMTMIIVSHEMQFVRDVSTRVMFLSQGVVVEEGPPARVMDNPSHPETLHFLRRLGDRESGAAPRRDA